MQPQAQRPDFPNYGINPDVKGMLTWDWVVQRMEKSINYWVSTTRPDGRPHAAPIWGVWFDNTLHFGTDRQSTKARNLMHNPAVVVHLESGDEVVILEGTALELANKGLYSQIRTLYGEKYPHTPDAQVPAGQVWYRIVPHIVLGWLEKDYPNTATRWTFKADRK